MLSQELSGQSLRPEWLFEVVRRVQVLAPSPADSSVAPTLDQLFELFPPESALEQQLKHELLARLKAEQAIWSARQVDHPDTLCVDASREPSPQSARLEAIVARAQQLLQSDFGSHWTVEGVARRVGCNRTDLERGFQRNCTYTVHRYLIVCRIDAAKQLLRNTAWRVGEVAKAVGFRSKVSLYEHFRRVLHMTPDEYRRRWTLVSANDQVRRLLSRLE